MTVSALPSVTPGADAPLTTSVVICAYTENRWDDLCAAVASVRAQTVPVGDVVLVIDHNDALAERASALDGVTVVPNRGERGLSGARNTGVEESDGELVLFLDDDAVAEPDWVERTAAAFADPDVVGAGGWVEPRWDSPGRPGWFPEPFLWVVGCSYQGLPATSADIRNPIGAAMAFRRRVFEAGGFSTVVGRVGSRPVGCEETEFAIRVRQADPRARIVLVPEARVRHRVTADRRRWRYLVRRCWYEGRSKRAVTATVGADGLSSERGYVARVLPRAVAAGLWRTARTGRPDGALSAVAVVVGLAATAAGYLAPGGRR